METHDSTPNPPSESAAEPIGSAVPAGRSGGGRSGAVGLWALGAGAVAALVSWLLIEATLDSFKPKGAAMRFMGLTLIIPGWQERADAVTRNAAVNLGLTGGVVGLALGLAGGLARRSARAGALAASLGLVLGAAAGAGTALAAVPLASSVHDRDPGSLSVEMASSLIVHGLPWAAIGAVGGLALGIGIGGRGRAGRGLLGGLLGAVAGALLYEVIGALALPGSKTVDPVATSWGIRLLAQSLAVLPAAAGVAALVRDRAPGDPSRKPPLPSPS
jgi:hypothetical protein